MASIDYDTLHRDGRMIEDFSLGEAPLTQRQAVQTKTRGKFFQPQKMTLWFIVFGDLQEEWRCTQALVEGPIVRQDGTLSTMVHKALWSLHMDDDTEEVAPHWVVAIAKERLATIKGEGTA